MKCIVSVILIISAALAYSGVAGFFTKENQDWAFIQAVGGMKVSLEQDNLVVDCDVSGTKEVTLKPTMVNSAMGVRKLKHKIAKGKIQLTLVTSVLEKGTSTSCKPLDLTAYPAGDYSVDYRNPDGTTHPVGKITLQPLKPVKNVETMLNAKVDHGIFGLTKETQAKETTFRFIEGSRKEKVDHATPLRVTVTVKTPREDGRGYSFKVEAFEHGLALKTRDKKAEKRWEDAVGKVIRGK